MHSLLAVSAPAATSGLTTRTSVKTELNISGSSEDSYIDSQIARVSALVCSYLRVARAEDGTCTLGKETLVETIRLPACREFLMLSRHPIVSVTSVVEDGTALEASEYEIDKAGGMLRRLSNDEPSEWLPAKIVVTYLAGWLLPGDASRNLPQDIEDAAIAWIKMQRAARLRDPLVKREDVPGVVSWEYWVGTVCDGAIPPDVAAKLDPYRNHWF